MALIRKDVADYLNISTSEEEEWVLLGYGFESLDEGMVLSEKSKEVNSIFLLVERQLFIRFFPSE